MKLKVNNQEICTEADTLSGLATELSWPSRGVAVAVNQCMVPRIKWEAFTLNEGDNILIIKAVCGG
ncbi:MAG: sulfur carrier protein ThiS [Bacteroidaceae bacterium]|mgnify:FL=1|nr:sulfur carrier protein ThiS [Bacteroidaceae bacterium]